MPYCEERWLATKEGRDDMEEVNAAIKELGKERKEGDEDEIVLP